MESLNKKKNRSSKGAFFCNIPSERLYGIHVIGMAKQRRVEERLFRPGIISFQKTVVVVTDAPQN